MKFLSSPMYNLIKTSFTKAELQLLRAEIDNILDDKKVIKKYTFTKKNDISTNQIVSNVSNNSKNPDIEFPEKQLLKIGMRSNTQSRILNYLNAVDYEVTTKQIANAVNRDQTNMHIPLKSLLLHGDITRRSRGPSKRHGYLYKIKDKLLTDQTKEKTDICFRCQRELPIFKLKMNDKFQMICSACEVMDE